MLTGPPALKSGGDAVGVFFNLGFDTHATALGRCYEALPLPKFGVYAVGRLYNLGGDAHTSQFEGANGGPLRAQSWGDAVGAFLQSEWRHSHYPTWKVLRGAPAPKVGGVLQGCFCNVSGDTHTTPLGRCYGAPPRSKWGECCRGVFAIQLEGLKGRPRPKSWGG